MQYNFHIPSEYQWQHGTHGSAWKYCCSLTGAAPTPYYKAGEALMKHNYEKKLRSPIHDRTVTVRDTYRREQQHRNTQNSIVRYEIGEDVSHPKFGTGNIEHVEQLLGSVRLHIRFGERTESDSIRNGFFGQNIKRAEYSFIKIDIILDIKIDIIWRCLFLYH